MVESTFQCPTRMKKSSDLERLLEISHLRVRELSDFVIVRLRLLNEETSFVSDEEVGLGYALKIFDAYPKAFNEDERIAVLQGTVLSDVGKAGSPDMTKKERELVLAMYGVENVPEGHKLTVGDFLRGAFCERLGLLAEEGARAVEAFGLMLQRLNPFSSTDPDKVGMPEFWSRGHLIWTTQALWECGLSARTVKAAGLHHRLEGVDPFGGMAKIDRSAALVALIDKYQAFRERSKLDHAKSVAIIKGMVGKSTASEEEKAVYLMALGMLECLPRQFRGTAEFDCGMWVDGGPGPYPDWCPVWELRTFPWRSTKKEALEDIRHGRNGRIDERP